MSFGLSFSELSKRQNAHPACTQVAKLAAWENLSKSSSWLEFSVIPDASDGNAVDLVQTPFWAQGLNLEEISKWPRYGNMARDPIFRPFPYFLRGGGAHLSACRVRRGSVPGQPGLRRRVLCLGLGSKPGQTNEMNIWRPPSVSHTWAMSNQYLNNKNESTMKQEGARQQTHEMTPLNLP